MRPCSAASTRFIGRATGSRFRRNNGACSSAITSNSCVPARRLMPARRRGSLISMRASPRSAQPSARTRWRTSRATRSCSMARMTSPGFRISCAQRRVRRPNSAGLPASTSSPSRARASNPSCNSPRDAICARRCSAPGSHAATAAALPTTRRSSPRWWHCAPSERGCSDMRPSRITGWMTPWRRRRTPFALLDRVWAPARRRVLADRDALQALVQAEGKNFPLAPWDWRYYAEKLRKVRCDIDEATIKPYLQLERIIEAAFYTASRLFGLTFERRDDVPVWHEDVRAWEVRDSAGRHRGIFFGDYFARASKHSGAWMTTLRDQERLTGDVHPLVVNVMNFSKAGDGEPTLLSFDDAKTLFHEFGHALHALLSDVTYPMISGTSVLQDWSELPSQLYEHWLERPEILRQFARHYRTGEAMPEDQLRRLVAARTFNQGQATVEYVASALIDLDIHLRPETDQAFDIGGFEQATLARIGMPDEIVMRHRPAHFQHIFAGNSYAAAYYSYLWSEVLDSDAFAAFEETGDIFDSGTAKKLHDHVYAAGGSCDPAELYTAFRGRLPTADGLLKRRGLSKDAA